MYLEIFLADFAVFRVFWGNSRDFAENPEIRGSATTRIIRSPVCVITYSLECISIFKGGGGGGGGGGGEVSIFLELPSVNLKAEKDRQSKNCGQKGCKLISDLNSAKKT